MVLIIFTLVKCLSIKNRLTAWHFLDDRAFVATHCSGSTGLHFLHTLIITLIAFLCTFFFFCTQTACFGRQPNLITMNTVVGWLSLQGELKLSSTTPAHATSTTTTTTTTTTMLSLSTASRRAQTEQEDDEVEEDAQSLSSFASAASSLLNQSSSSFSIDSGPYVDCWDNEAVVPVDSLSEGDTIATATTLQTTTATTPHTIATKADCDLMFDFDTPHTPHTPNTPHTPINTSECSKAKQGNDIGTYNLCNLLNFFSWNARKKVVIMSQPHPLIGIQDFVLVRADIVEGAITTGCKFCGGGRADTPYVLKYCNSL